MSTAALKWAWDQMDIPGPSKFVLVALAENADDDGMCWPGLKYVADRVRQSQRSVSRHVRTLVDAGKIGVEKQQRLGGGQSSNLYRLFMRTGLVEGDDKLSPPPHDRKDRGPTTPVSSPPRHQCPPPHDTSVIPFH